MRYWCEHAWLGGEAAVAGVLLEIEGDRIVAVTPGAERMGERLAGLTLPGLANAHSHAFQRALRGRTQRGTGTFWTWREQMYALAEGLDPDALFALSRATFAEMALAGITCVGEFHYVHHAPDGTPYEDPNALGHAVVAAAAEAGVRITLIDACYLHGGIARFRDASAVAWAERASALAAALERPAGPPRAGADPPRAGADPARAGATGPAPAARVGAAIHSVRAVDPAAAAVVAAWAGDRPLHAHVSEQPGENEWCQEQFGRTPTQVLADAGALGHAFTAIHATHLTDADVALLAPATVCLCPTTERDLADGIGPAHRFARLATGSDSQAIIDPFEEARAIELDERLATGTRGVHTPSALLAAATNHACIGWPEAGRLEAGALADLITVDLETVRTAGTEPLQGTVYAAAAPDVRDVMVGGEWIVRGGVHGRLDVARELRAAL